MGGTAQVYAGVEPSAATTSFTIVETYRYRGEHGFDTGLELIDARPRRRPACC